MFSKVSILRFSSWVIFWVIFSSFHPFYISVSEVKLKEETNNIEISIKCFSNDLETVLNCDKRIKIDLFDNLQFEKNKLLLQEYFERNFKILANKKLVKIRILGFEKEEDAIWTYFETDKVKITKRPNIEIESQVLYSLSKEQLNIIHVTKGDLRKSTKIKFPQTKCVFNF